MIFLGIDPGVKGGLAFLDFNALTLIVIPMPLLEVNSKTFIDGEAIQNELLVNIPNQAIIEDVSSMPTDGVVSAFNFGFRTGIVWGALQSYKLTNRTFTIAKVRPAYWKATMGVSANKKQTASVCHQLLPLCVSILPSTKDGLVEASMLSVYAALEHSNGREFAKNLKLITPGGK